MTFQHEYLKHEARWRENRRLDERTGREGVVETFGDFDGDGGERKKKAAG